MLNRTKKHNYNEHLPELNLTPLIDVVLVLLLIFMLSAPIMKNSINVDLPFGNVNEDSPGMQSGDDCFYVSMGIDSKGNKTLYLNNELVNKDNIIDKLKIKLSKSKDSKHTVRVNCDEKRTYGEFMELVDKIKYLGGVKNVVLETYKA